VKYVGEVVNCITESAGYSIGLPGLRKKGRIICVCKARWLCETS